MLNNSENQTDNLLKMAIKNQKGRKTLWVPKKSFIDHDLTTEDCRNISEQFYIKYSSLNGDYKYRPDPMKDFFYSKFYKQEEFDFYEFANRNDCISPLKCEQLRIQHFYLLDFVKNELRIIKDLKICMIMNLMRIIKYVLKV